MRYRAFISYSHADAAAAAWLHRKLEGWRVPRRMRTEDPALPDKLAPVFRDREELGSAGELGPQIQAALADSDALIVLCSPEAARSRWVDSEVRAFRAGGRGERVFALIVSGEPHSGGERECFPPALRESEPLAADLRAGKDGKELALLKLIAGLLGVPLDTLRQREARRRHQRMLAVTSLAVVVMLVTSFLAVQASIARQAAERRQKQAEALVGFMIGDLNDKLNEVSRSDIMENVHNHAMEYFQSLPDTDVTDQALAQRALALTKIGNVRRDRGQLDKALESYRAAGKLTSKLAQAAPSDVARQLAHAEVLSYIGMCHWYEGKLDEAMRGFDGALAVLLKAQSLAPDNVDLKFQLSTIDNNAGHVLESRGRIDEAVVHYRRMRSLSEQLVAREPSKLDYQNQLGLAHNNLAKMALLQGRLGEAISGYEADVAIEAALANKDPKNNAQAERLLIARATLGRTLALAGRLDDAAAALHAALVDARRLVQVDGDVAYFREDVAIYAWQLARVHRMRGEAADAAARVAESLAASEVLVKADTSQPGFQRDRAEALLERARQRADGGDADGARADLSAALEVLEPQLAQQPDDRGVVLATASAWLQLAALSPPARAKSLLDRALASCEAPKSATGDPRLRALYVEALLRLGDRTRAEPLSQALWREGFRDPDFAKLLKAHSLATPTGVALGGTP
jgi:tetratricopeptide (TPR) repeat protein